MSTDAARKANAERGQAMTEDVAELYRYLKKPWITTRAVIDEISERVHRVPAVVERHLSRARRQGLL